MKNNIYFIVFALLFACDSQPPVIQYYKSGEVFIRGEKKDGQLHGKVYIYFKNGSLNQCGSYIDGIKHGQFVTFYANGQKKDSVYFDKGKEHGLYLYYPDSIDRYYQKSCFINGKCEGLFIEYFADGSIRDVIEYRNDKPHGWRVEFDQKGDTVRKGYYEEGNPLFQWNYENNIIYEFFDDSDKDIKLQEFPKKLEVNCKSCCK